MTAVLLCDQPRIRLMGSHGSMPFYHCQRIPACVTCKVYFNMYKAPLPRRLRTLDSRQAI